MINRPLFFYEMKKSVKLLIIFMVILTMYVGIIMTMYDPEYVDALGDFYRLMPEIMDAVGMDFQSGSMIEFMISYLYGFILLVFPMVFSIFRANGLVAKYVDDSSIVPLLGAPVRREKFIDTQISVLLSGIVILIGYTTLLQLVIAHYTHPGELVYRDLLALNLGLLALHFFIAGICFLASCIFSETRNSLAFGAGIPSVMFIISMLANVGEEAEAAKYFTFFTLFQAEGLAAGETEAYWGAFILALGALILFTLARFIFARRDLHI